MNTLEVKSNSTNLKLALMAFLLSFGVFGMAGVVEAGAAGVVTIFDTLGTETDNSVFGPLGAAIITLAAAAGGLFAILKGAWLMAGLGIGVAGLMFGAQLVATSAGFGALI